jgi:hypothetical protein
MTPTGTTNATLEDYRITCMDFERALVDIRLNNPIHFTPKIHAMLDVLEMSHVIDVSRYDRVYITSDIHADFRKLLQLLSDAGLIRLPYIDGVPADPYSDDVYHTDIICDTKWSTDSRVLFVIAGDLVDGCRQCEHATQTQLNDKVGSFEFLTLCFLYNLRIQAMQRNSNVLFTIGNHDLHSVLSEDEGSWFWSQYVDYSAKRFFGASSYRRQVLEPFYDLSPYFMLSLENPAARMKEVAVVHGSFHGEDRTDNLTWCSHLQQSVDRVGLHKTLTQTVLQALDNQASSPMWSRVYAKSPSRCDLINELGYKLVVVGHCTTDDPRYDAFANSKPDASNGKVVVFNCDRPNSQSSVAFVDVAISHCFRASGNRNDVRRVEMLHLVCNPQFNAKSPSIPYYAIDTYSQPTRIPRGPSDRLGEYNTDVFLTGPADYKEAYWYRRADSKTRRAYMACRVKSPKSDRAKCNQQIWTHDRTDKPAGAYFRNHWQKPA